MFGRAITILAVALAVSGIEASFPGPMHENTVSLTDQQIIVGLHNNIRLQLALGVVIGQPKASNMKRMRWDPALAQAAQAIANTCVFADVKVNDTRSPVGQNEYARWSMVFWDEPNWPAAITAWLDERRMYMFGTTQYNNYTQVVWATSDRVGCGYNQCQSARRSYLELYVCNYSPAGNVAGLAPYQKGFGCEFLC